MNEECFQLAIPGSQRPAGISSTVHLVWVPLFELASTALASEPAGSIHGLGVSTANRADRFIISQIFHHHFITAQQTLNVASRKSQPGKSR